MTLRHYPFHRTLPLMIVTKVLWVAGKFSLLISAVLSCQSYVFTRVQLVLLFCVLMRIRFSRGFSHVTLDVFFSFNATCSVCGFEWDGFAQHPGSGVPSSEDSRDSSSDDDSHTSSVTTCERYLFGVLGWVIEYTFFFSKVIRGFSF